jgi:hypothetical protein
MANTWNQSGTTWGQNSYGLQTEVNVSLTGLSTTTTLGELPYAAADDGWGRDGWNVGNWGDNTTTVPLTGLTATTTVGTFPYAQATDGWGRDAWNQNAWGQDGITVSLAGLGLTATSSLPSVGWGNQVFGSDNEGWGGIYQLPVADVMGLTGLSADADLGTATAKSDFSTELTGLSLQSTVGLVETDDHSVGLSGFAATTALGTATTTQLTIAALTGLEAETDVGAVTISSNPIHLLTGLSAQTTLGNVIVADVMGLTGLSAQTALGALTTTQLTIASLDSLGLTATTTLNDAINLQYFNRKVPKDSTGYSRKVPKDSTGYTRKVAN